MKTANDVFKPYAYQETLCEAFFEGANPVVLAPTGGGKTHAGLLPGLECLDHALNNPADYPSRIIYTTPLRSLTHGFQRNYAESARQRRWERSWYPTVQTGEIPDDPLFEGQVIFATVDQMLASYINMPYGLPNQLDNINAGAMIGAYLIFDEFHLYPRDQMMLTVLAMLFMLKEVSRFTLMTATCSSSLLHKIRDLLGAHLIADPPGTPLYESIFRDIKILHQRQRTWQTADPETRLNAAEVLRHSSQARSTLVICNVVDRARALYEALKDDGRYSVYLAHSRFYRADRQQAEQEILTRLDPEYVHDDRPVIVIATQVVEVGFDISADVLLTECAPAASLIQRAGRCARRAGDGRVIIYQPRDEDGTVNYAPYSDEDFADICQKTWATLREHFNDRVMDFAEEQRLVEMVHGEADAVFAETLPVLVERRIQQITDCMRERDPGYIGSLIRRNDNVPLYIHDAPNQDEHLTKSLGRYQAFSLSRGQIMRLMETASAAGCDAEFYLCGGRNETVDDPDSPYPQRFIKWHALRKASEVFDPAYRAFVAHPQIISYDPCAGLLLSPGPEAAPISPPTPPRRFERIRYEAERYHEHLTGLRDAYTKPLSLENRSYTRLHDEAVYTLNRLCARFGKGDPADAERLLRLTLALHDLGKLNQPWQTWARDWQQLRTQRLNRPATIPPDDFTPLAHTDYNSGDNDEYELQKEFNRRIKRGRHAVESAEAAAEIVRQATDGDEFWMAIILGAIAHHHAPDVEGRCDHFRTADGWEATFDRALYEFGFEPEAYRPLVRTAFAEAGEDVQCAIEDVKPKFTNYTTALFYLVFVRILRLADQRSGYYWRQYRGAYTYE